MIYDFMELKNMILREQYVANTEPSKYIVHQVVTAWLKKELQK